MRFEIRCKLEKKVISTDYRRKILSFFKRSLEEYNREIKKAIYDDPERRNFTFSVYLPVEKIEKDRVYLKNDGIKVFLSVENMMEALHFLNALIGSKGKKFSMGENSFVVRSIHKREEIEIVRDEVIFKALSPIVIREVREGKNSWYHDFDKKGMEILKKNTLYNLKDKFYKSSLEEFEVVPIKTRRTVVSFYKSNFPVTLGTFYVKADKKILNYLYKSGFGSRSSAGFGMLEVIE
ncbi:MULTISPECIES: CRISPR-associated endoribonuclease Cas6 [Psychrilyobacter]|uniref:CRISPR-associated endoribonuclease Cas6 n=1 Tax=Psychrilyobacter piezotolerans TaxID=2293438 RepID=A0ABX9KFQ9_9FUSO|nr:MULTISPECIES: CRISPR-associated endoribonuclease Cas6 [Psychrilyobacter]MCS5420966.1 CRISPR-associated endoribonuclease Cas6 [Psychrilyobacter sp. S5]NDI78767.1 CRISPR-associated endoribonuclease Cas6 [Psychrilyobacter piezotolerans]RDE60868.1 CRISPR-associated endoribonuclease Cas6 [Psychrilyobacter sp. S5]REI40657.1 CRISPR-associated endoribonuclease Cas6 [Psychrilyobacter piezotolerans]